MKKVNDSICRGIICGMVIAFFMGSVHASELMKKQSKEYVKEGIKEQREGNIDYAITLYQKAVYADPENAKAYNNLGTAYAQKGLYEQAEQHYQKAVQIDTTYSVPLMNIALLYAQRGDYDTFFEYWKRAQGLDVFSPFLVDDEED